MRQPGCIRPASEAGVPQACPSLQNPGEEKYRKIKLSNAAFQSRVAALPASLDFLSHVGFQQDTADEFLVLPADRARLEILNAAGEVLNNAITNPMFGIL